METDEKDGAAKEAEESEPAKAARAPEALMHRLDNPCRVTPAQQKFVALEDGSRWRPIHPARPLTGIIVFKDMEPGAPSPQCRRGGPSHNLPLGPAVPACQHPTVLQCCQDACKEQALQCGAISAGPSCVSASLDDHMLLGAGKASAAARWTGSLA